MIDDLYDYDAKINAFIDRATGKVAAIERSMFLKKILLLSLAGSLGLMLFLVLILKIFRWWTIKTLKTGRRLLRSHPSLNRLLKVLSLSAIRKEPWIRPLGSEKWLLTLVQLACRISDTLVLIRAHVSYQYNCSTFSTVGTNSIHSKPYVCRSLHKKVCFSYSWDNRVSSLVSRIYRKDMDSVAQVHPLT